MKGLSGRTILVTGAGSGIGAATAERLHAEGSSVVAGDLNRPGLEDLAARLGDDRLVIVDLDVTDPSQTDAFVAAAETCFGRIDGLVNSAGIRGVGTVLDTDHDTWRRVLSVNLDGTFHMCQSFAKAAIKLGTPASIVNLSSAAGLRATPNRLGYVASKFAVVGISQAMALELTSSGIRVNVVAPGMTRTPLTKVMFEDPANVERIVAALPIGRYGEAEDIASAIVFLLSDESAFMTAAVLAVDGGNTAGIPSH